jgi:hypothetical protein
MEAKEPVLGLLRTVGCGVSVNSHWIPVILQAVQLAYNRAMEDAEEEEEEED